MDSQSGKRKLTRNEVEDIISFLDISSTDNIPIPHETAKSISDTTKIDILEQLKKIEIHPALIGKLKKKLKREYIDSLIQPGECVGVIVAQSIGEKQTQTNLNTFHKAGSSDNQPVVSVFSELLNATMNPKSPSYTIYFKEGNSSIKEIRETIGSTIVQVMFKRIIKDIRIEINKVDEKWYSLFEIIHGKREKNFNDCLSIKIDMDFLFEYKIKLSDISEKLQEEYPELYCIYSPDCFGQIDIFIDSQNIELDEKQILFVTENNKSEIFLDEVVQPQLEGTILFGIKGIQTIYYKQKREKDRSEWFIETENVKEKKEKLENLQTRFRKILSHPKVDMTQTASNNIWEIYQVFGIEAVREYMIEQFSSIMEGINLCHVMLLVDKMTYTGSISSISRYTMRKEENSVFCSSSFEETLDNFLKAGFYAYDEPTSGISASIICGKKSRMMGSGICEVVLDLEKYGIMKSTITEEENEESTESVESIE